MYAQEKREGTMAAKQGTRNRGGGLRRTVLAVCAAAMLVACAFAGRAQQSGSMEGVGTGGVRGFPQEGGPFSVSGSDEVDSVQAERRLNALNAERQKSLAADSARLLKLATELNEQVAKSNGGELTPDQLRMVAEIEKLAHNVRDKMAMSLRGPQYPAMDAPVQSFPQVQRH